MCCYVQAVSIYLVYAFAIYYFTPVCHDNNNNINNTPPTLIQNPKHRCYTTLMYGTLRVYLKACEDCLVPGPCALSSIPSYH